MLIIQRNQTGLSFIKRLIKNSNLINIYENYEDYRNIENWIELIHSKEHINTLKSNFSLAEKVSRHAVSICLEGVDRIMEKKNRNIFLCNSPSWSSCIKYRKTRRVLFL